MCWRWLWQLAGGRHTSQKKKRRYVPHREAQQHSSRFFTNRYTCSGVNGHTIRTRESLITHSGQPGHLARTTQTAKKYNTAFKKKNLLNPILLDWPLDWPSIGDRLMRSETRQQSSCVIKDVELACTHADAQQDLRRHVSCFNTPVGITRCSVAHAPSARHSCRGLQSIHLVQTKGPSPRSLMLSGI